MRKKKDKTKGLPKQHIKKVKHSKSKLASLRSGVFAIVGVISAVALFDMIIPLSQRVMKMLIILCVCVCVCVCVYIYIKCRV